MGGLGAVHQAVEAVQVVVGEHGGEGGARPVGQARSGKDQACSAGGQAQSDRGEVGVRPGGGILLEIGAAQAAAVTELARQAFPQATVAVHQDLAGHDRVVVINTDETRRQGDKETRR